VPIAICGIAIDARNDHPFSWSFCAKELRKGMVINMSKKFCTNCGMAHDENARFCTGCGASMEQFAQSQYQTPPLESQQYQQYQPQHPPAMPTEPQQYQPQQHFQSPKNQ